MKNCYNNKSVPIIGTHCQKIISNPLRGTALIGRYPSHKKFSNSLPKITNSCLRVSRYF